MTIITLDHAVVSTVVHLHCVTCQTVTRHVLIKSGTAYVCACGSEIQVEYKEDDNS